MKNGGVEILYLFSSPQILDRILKRDWLLKHRAKTSASVAAFFSTDYISEIYGRSSAEEQLGYRIGIRFLEIAQTEEGKKGSGDWGRGIR
ncbi:hypothetical protein TorRG33x02_056750 [Trema orientale]|uniref:Uncharacterized protein n=1 Tax=Trema orientale TaxID=63057 RepID=A0A2P5FKX5_TREOI|nr:hypothetical protein TorRG33x02_056750 [Trema orientale]